jgi:hypothetical protein
MPTPPAIRLHTATLTLSSPWKASTARIRASASSSPLIVTQAASRAAACFFSPSVKAVKTITF